MKRRRQQKEERRIRKETDRKGVAKESRIRKRLNDNFLRLERTAQGLGFDYITSMSKTPTIFPESAFRKTHGEYKYWISKFKGSDQGL